MRTVAFTALGSVDGIELHEADEPSIDDDEVLVNVAAVGLNRHDLAVLRGESWVADRHLPFVSGLDVAGTVAAVGDAVEGIKTGVHVVVGPGRSCGVCEFCRQGPETLCERFRLAHGGFAEQVAVPADRLVTVPDTLSTVEAASLPTAGMTAWQMIRRAEVEPGDAVLVPGATGGVGVAAVQLLEAEGVDAVATSRSEAKLERLADLGATNTLVAESAADLSDALADVGTLAAALVHLGGSWVTESLNGVRRGGIVVVCGQTASESATVDVAGMYIGHKHLIGSSMGTQRDLKRVIKLTGDGRIEPLVAREYRFDAAREAFEALATSDIVGKIVLRP